MSRMRKLYGERVGVSSSFLSADSGLVVRIESGWVGLKYEAVSVCISQQNVTGRMK